MNVTRSEKKNILDLIENMKILHTMLVESSDDLLTDYLSTCQQAVISVGDLLEKNSLDGLQDTISTLEQYAEYCYEISVRGECTTGDVKYLDNLIGAVSKKIGGLSTKIQVAFFPYKAEMWDSLESIYLAAVADPDCEAKVIPIPYYEMDQTAGKWVLKYDGGDFPLGIPIKFYKEYDVQAEQPDIAYIHNPYDNYNLVTSVHPDYYSFELKKYVGKLVYVPYYVNAGMLSHEHKVLPCYEHVDYIVLQSKQAKEDCRGMYYYDKILPLGSPKLDRVIRKCKEGVSMPKSWESVIGGRRTLMLNSTIADLLQYNEKIFIKLKSFFEYIRSYKEIAVIWRPHPLYEATIRSMRPALLQKYTELKSFFLDNGIGVFDTTSDISSTVAVADGYIGSPGSSVINLFGAVGKPIFLFNDTITDIVSDEESRILRFDSCCDVGDKVFAYSHYPDYLFEINLQDCTDKCKDVVRPITRIARDKLYTYPYWYMMPLLGKLYFSPTAASELAEYDPKKGKVKNIHADINLEDLYFYGMQICDDSVFLMTAGHEQLAEYSVGKHKWIYHKRELEQLFGYPEMNQNAGIMGSAVYKKNIYFSTGITNRILSISVGTGKFEIMDLGTDSATNSMPVFLLGASAEGLWLEILSNTYRKPGTAGIYLAPWECLNSIKDWKYFSLMPRTESGYEDMSLVRFFAKAYDISGYIVIFMSREKKIFRINRKSGEISLLAERFWETLSDEDSQAAGGKIVLSIVTAGENRFLIQRFSDKRMALINVSDDTYMEFIPRLSEGDLETVRKENEGFGKDNKAGYFAMRESRMYSLEYFLKQFTRTGWEEIRNRQVDALESFAANLDGSCGEKVHEAVVRATK